MCGIIFSAYRLPLWFSRGVITTGVADEPIGFMLSELRSTWLTSIWTAFALEAILTQPGVLFLAVF